MGTTRNPLAGRYFNDPNIAVGLSNLAAAFAPPSPEEYLLAEQVKGERLTNQARGDMYGLAGGDFDKLGIVANLFDPTGSFYAVNTADATARRGQDITAQTAITNNRTDNVFDLAQAYATQPLTFGEAMAGLPPEFAAAIGTPVLPATSGMAAGAPKPAPTLAEAQGALFNQGAEMLTDDQIAAYAFGDTPVTNIVTADGPRVATTLGAIGQEPLVNQGGKAAADLLNYVTPDGREGSAVFDPNTQELKDAATGAPLPPGSTTFKLQGGDKNAVVGATTSNMTEGNEIVALADYGLGRTAKFRALLEANPGVLGIPGMVRGYAQDIAAAANEMGAAYGTIDGVDEIYTLAERVGANGNYDPAIAQAMAYALEMAYLQAKMQDPGGEVNVRELEQLVGIYDGGIAGNAKVLANLDVLDGQFMDRKAFGSNLRQGAPGATPPAAPSATGGTRLRFDANGDPVP